MMPSTEQRRTTCRTLRIVYISGTVILLVVALGAMAWHILPKERLAEQYLLRLLHAQGVTAQMHITQLSTRQLQAENIRLLPDGAITAANLSARYSLASLLRGQVEHIRITGAELHASTTTDGTLHLSGLPSTTTSAETSPLTQLPALPFQQLQLDAARLYYTAPDGLESHAMLDATLHHDYTGRIHMNEARIALNAEESITFSDATLERSTPDAPVVFTLGRLAHVTGGKAYFTPLQGSGTATLARDNRAVEGNISLHDTSKRWNMTLAGAVNMQTQQWHVEFSQPMTRFETGLLQPDMLFPLLRGYTEQVNGALALDGRVESHDGIVTSYATLTVAQLGGVFMDVAVTGMDGIIRFSPLWPPATPEQQQVSVDEIVLGLPLKKGVLRFSLAEDGRLRFAPSAWQWAGGTLHTSGATTQIYAPSLPDIRLSAKGLALEELLASLLQQGISATGKLDGHIPVHFTPQGEAMIRGGTLTTEHGGTIRYAPPGDSPLQKGHSFQTDILLNALEDFHYDTLSMTINSKDADVLEVQLHLRGKNPKLYNGQIIELNINLSGNLLDIVQSGMSIYTLPERLQEQFLP